MLEAKVEVTLKKTVADPQGLTIKHALESLGYKDVEDARIGKLIILRLKTSDKKKAERELNEMCKKLLANPIIEDYKFEIKEV
jgi:phosphoribosylformylglycinamidine synthase PurS subunit